MLIGIDVGTTSVKAALFDEQGTIVKSFAQRYPTYRPLPNHVEQDPHDWVQHVFAALELLSQDLKPGQVQAIGLCSQVNTHAFIDATGNPLFSAMTWQDTRCAEDAATLDAQISSDEKIQWWGAPLPIDASHVLARMAYIFKHHHSVWHQTQWVMAPKDYCLYRLTGTVASDAMTSFGIVDGHLKKIPKLIGLVPGADKRLPPISNFTDTVGRVRNGLPCAGTPVVTCTMDAWSGMFGAGVSADGECVYLSGTSEILGIISPNKTPTPGVIAFPKCEGIVLHAGPTQSGGASVEWLGRVLGRTASEISDLAGQADLTRDLPIFLPHLEGERAPLWDTTARGSFAGLSSSMAAPELARAVLEGVAYSARLVLEALEASAGCKPATINHSGGGAASDVWCQIRADILNRPVRRTKMRDAGVLGAAVMAGVGCGRFTSLHDATRELVQMDRIFEPNPAEQDRHQKVFQNFGTLYRQLIPFNAALKYPPA
jgi:xylulokinase